MILYADLQLTLLLPVIFVVMMPSSSFGRFTSSTMTPGGEDVYKHRCDLDSPYSVANYNFVFTQTFDNISAAYFGWLRRHQRRQGGDGLREIRNVLF